MENLWKYSIVLNVSSFNMVNYLILKEKNKLIKMLKSIPNHWVFDQLAGPVFGAAYSTGSFRGVLVF